MTQTQLSLPIILTLIRLIGSFLVLPFFLIYLLPYNVLWLNICLSTLFFLCGLTDFFDGYLARKYNQVTTTGALLDHVADKFLLYSTLIALIASQKLYFVWAIIWIGREFFIMALRQQALENNFSINVSSWGKLKTALQILCLSFIIVNPYQQYGLYACSCNVIELILLLIATGISVISAHKYTLIFIKNSATHNS